MRYNDLSNIENIFYIFYSTFSGKIEQIGRDNTARYIAVNLVLLRGGAAVGRWTCD